MREKEGGREGGKERGREGGKEREREGGSMTGIKTKVPVLLCSSQVDQISFSQG